MVDGPPIDGPHVNGAAGLIAVFPEPAADELIKLLDLDGYRWKAIAADDEGGLESAMADQSAWDAAIVTLGHQDRDADRAWRFCQEVRSADTPVLLLVDGVRLDEIPDHESAFDDFIILPFHGQEFRSRLHLLMVRAGNANRPELITYGPLSLNVETYQAIVDGRHLDLTFMEYELLRFLAVSPGHVFTRETLLNQVWGYEYYGGARTVDVHVRRLRAKMGEDHSSLISTVRGVGYKLGNSPWQG